MPRWISCWRRAVTAAYKERDPMTKKTTTTRTARVRRNTTETQISIDLNIDGRGSSTIETGMPFLNHMLELFARHALIDLKLKAVGDLEVDYHHTVEDVGLALGSAIDKALGTRKGIVRYGAAYVPMDETLGRVVVDLGGRPYLVSHMACRKKKILEFELALLQEFFQAFVVQARMNLHIEQFYGSEPHHAWESVFKAWARAMRTACAIDPRESSVPSSTGRI
jgi:imidazoleglycerol-phosphate dehydratase